MQQQQHPGMGPYDPPQQIVGRAPGPPQGAGGPGMYPGGGPGGMMNTRPMGQMQQMVNQVVPGGPGMKGLLFHESVNCCNRFFVTPYFFTVRFCILEGFLKMYLSS